MKLIYRLYSPLSECLKKLSQTYREFIQEKGEGIVESLSETMTSEGSTDVLNKVTETQFVTDMIEFCENYVKLLK